VFYKQSLLELQNSSKTTGITNCHIHFLDSRSGVQFSVTFRPCDVTWTRSCGCFAVLQSIAWGGLTPRQPLDTEGGGEQTLCQLKMFPAEVGYSEKFYHLCRHV